jgi:YggT family protein
MDTLSNIAVFLIDTLFSLYISIVVIRFLLALARASFHNQISQFIIKATNPVLFPLRRIIPSIGKIDTSAIVLALALILTKSFLILSLKGADINLIVLLIYSVVELVRTIIWIYIIALLIQAVLSWIANSNSASNPLVGILYSLTNPILHPIRNVVPNIGMVDISPFVAILGLHILLIIVNGLGV